MPVIGRFGGDCCLAFEACKFFKSCPCVSGDYCSRRLSASPMALFLSLWPSDSVCLTERVPFLLQVVRAGGVDIGILLSKDEEEDERATEVTHWIVSVDGSSEEEIISEKALGRVLETHDQSDGSTFEKAVKEKPVKKSSKTKVKSSSSKSKNKRASTRAASKNGEDSLLLSNGLDFERRQTARPKKQDGDETVIEVKMLTGSLFIYRGDHHRVEFVRTV